MLFAPEYPVLLQRLRSETRPFHDALEQNDFNQSLLAGNVSPETTTHFLARLYGFLKPYEDQLDQHAFGPEWNIEERHRAHLILQDLQPATGLALCPDMPPLASRAQLLGAMYVLEGSTLGGQVVARQLAKAGIETRTYFTGYAERTGPMWKSFCQLLTEESANENQTETVNSASLTFQKLHAWINQP